MWTLCPNTNGSHGLLACAIYLQEDTMLNVTVLPSALKSTPWSKLEQPKYLSVASMWPATRDNETEKVTAEAGNEVVFDLVKSDIITQKTLRHLPGCLLLRLCVCILLYFLPHGSDITYSYTFLLPGYIVQFSCLIFLRISNNYHSACRILCAQ